MFEPRDFVKISLIPAISKTGRTDPPAITPVPSLAGLSKIILELYFALINEKYTPKQTYKPLENRIFEKEYNFFLKALLDTDFYFNDEYSLEEQRYILLQEQEMWNNLMNIRNKISKHLTGNAKYVYNNATYHLQKQHLVELKNEYGEYGVTGAEYQKLLLTDSCSYEELLNTKRPRVILQERWK